MAYPGSGTSAYLQASVMGSSPERLVVLLYEHLLASLRRGGVQMSNGELEAKAVSFEKAQAIVLELIAALDFEKGGEIATRLAALYSWFLDEIAAVSRTLDRERLERLCIMIADLHRAWVEAADSLRRPAGHGAAAR